MLLPKSTRRAARSSPAWRRSRAAVIFAALNLGTAMIPVVPFDAPTPTPDVDSGSMIVNTAMIGTKANPQSAKLLADLINVARARADVPPVFIDVSLVAAARQAQSNPSGASSAALLAGNIDSAWTHGGEVRGYGPSVVEFLDAVLASDDHRALALDPAFTRIGLVVNLGGVQASVLLILTDGDPHLG